MTSLTSSLFSWEFDYGTKVATAVGADGKVRKSQPTIMKYVDILGLSARAKNADDFIARINKRPIDEDFGSDPQRSQPSASPWRNWRS